MFEKVFQLFFHATLNHLGSGFYIPPTLTSLRPKFFGFFGTLNGSHITPLKYTSRHYTYRDIGFSLDPGGIHSPVYLWGVSQTLGARIYTGCWLSFFLGTLRHNFRHPPLGTKNCTGGRARIVATSKSAKKRTQRYSGVDHVGDFGSSCTFFVNKLEGARCARAETCTR